MFAVNVENSHQAGSIFIFSEPRNKSLTWRRKTKEAEIKKKSSRDNCRDGLQSARDIKKLIVSSVRLFIFKTHDMRFFLCVCACVMDESRKMRGN